MTWRTKTSVVAENFALKVKLDELAARCAKLEAALAAAVKAAESSKGYPTEVSQAIEKIRAVAAENGDPVLDQQYTRTSDPPSPARLRAVADHIHSLGAYTQAREIERAADEVERARGDRMTESEEEGWRNYFAYLRSW